jgi:hypothetical protein
MTIIPALGRLKQKDSKFEACLGYLGRPCLLKKREKRKEKGKKKAELAQIKEMPSKENKQANKPEALRQSQKNKQWSNC